MLGLTVNNFIESFDLDEYEVHRTKASTLDINDIVPPRVEFNPVVSEPMPDLETDDEEDTVAGATTSVPSLRTGPIIQELGEDDIPPLQVTPLRVLPPATFGAEQHGTPVGYTGSSAGTTQNVLPAVTSAAEPQGTPGGCSTSSSPRDKLIVPKTEPRDDFDQRSRPSLELFRDTRKKMKKTPYSELPPDVVIDVSDDEDGDMDILGQFGLDSEANKKVKEEALSVAELNARFEQKMKEKMAEAAEENARKMSVIQEELRASNAKTDAILAMLSRLASSTQAPPPCIPISSWSIPPSPLPPKSGFPRSPILPWDTLPHAGCHSSVDSNSATP